MTSPDDFDFDPIGDTFDNDDFFLENEEKNTKPVNPEEEQAPSGGRRSSADFEPDMDLLLISAQTPMIIEGMKLISNHDFRSRNVVIFSEAIKGIELYMKILQRNPGNFRKVSSMMSTDPDFCDLLKITSNLYRNLFDELPSTDSNKLKSFELVKDHLDTALKKSLISSSLVSIKKYFLLTGDPDTLKIDAAVNANPDKTRSEFAGYGRHVNFARELIKSGNFEINKGMKGKEMNVFIVRATMLLIYYYTKTGETQYASYYQRLNDNFKKYFVIR
ncbi:MAG TPA: hypothetical protein PK514_13560 [Spirochaetota bacterium]|nr:hypothetical protein [Spirochaetota bacterium]